MSKTDDDAYVDATLLNKVKVYEPLDVHQILYCKE